MPPKRTREVRIVRKYLDLLPGGVYTLDARLADRLVSDRFAEWADVPAAAPKSTKVRRPRTMKG